MLEIHNSFSTTIFLQSTVVEAPIMVAGKNWEVTCVSMGNPHAVVFVDDLDKVDLNAVGPHFETHPAFPAKINTEFVQVFTKTLTTTLPFPEK